MSFFWTNQSLVRRNLDAQKNGQNCWKNRRKTQTPPKNPCNSSFANSDTTRNGHAFEVSASNPPLMTWHDDGLLHPRQRRGRRRGLPSDRWIRRLGGGLMRRRRWRRVLLLLTLLFVKPLLRWVVHRRRGVTHGVTHGNGGKIGGRGRLCVSRGARTCPGEIGHAVAAALLLRPVRRARKIGRRLRW